MTRTLIPALLVGLAASLPLQAQTRADECSSCAEWNQPQRPFRIHGNTFYVGTHGLGAILVTSPQGHVLIDGGLPESAPLIEANIRELGFRVEDVKLILNSHAHFDHAGGIAALQRASGAQVAASAWSAPVLLRGNSGPDDPQHGVLLGFPGVQRPQVLPDGHTVRLGPLALVGHLTPGHTPGGTTWAWRSCEGARCLHLVYADSQTPVSADGFLYSRRPEYLAGFERSYATLERLPCDVLITPHPSASGLWERVAKGNLVDTDACRRYAATARQALARRVASETAQPSP